MKILLNGLNFSQIQQLFENLKLSYREIYFFKFGPNVYLSIE
ncbi:MAG: hypothetical protein QXV64_03560 [Candidatus Anstonellaceae archaeon]